MLKQPGSMNCRALSLFVYRGKEYTFDATTKDLAEKLSNLGAKPMCNTCKEVKKVGDITSYLKGEYEGAPIEIQVEDNTLRRVRFSSDVKIRAVGNKIQFIVELND